MREEWRLSPVRPDRYEVSNIGRVRSRFRNGRVHLLTPHVKPWGYLRVTFNVDGKDTYFDVHRLVAQAFIGARLPGQVIRHLDGDPTNNCVDNLAYGTVAENNRDTVRHGKNPWASSTHCRRGHEYTEANTRFVRGATRRICRACEVVRSRDYQIRKAARMAVSS
jgi:hypothetical protein